MKKLKELNTKFQPTKYSEFLDRYYKYDTDSKLQMQQNYDYAVLHMTACRYTQTFRGKLLLPCLVLHNDYEGTLRSVIPVVLVKT